MKRPLFRLTQMQSVGRWLIPGDIHFPVHSARLFDIMLRHSADLQPDHLLLQGDTMNAQGLSRFRSQKDPPSEVSLKREDDVAAPLLRALVKTITGTTYAGPGNHEKFILRHADENPAFQDMEWWEPWHRSFSQIDTLLPPDYRLKIGSLVVEHGDNLKGALQKEAAKNVLSNYPTQNTACGHNHRIQSAMRSTSKDGSPVSHGAWSLGTLADPSKMSGQDSDAWQYGWGVLDVFPGGHFTMTQIVAHWEGSRPVVRCPLLRKTYR